MLFVFGVSLCLSHTQSRASSEQINPNGWRMTCETQTTITATPTPVYDLLPMEGQQMIKTESRSQATHAATTFECVLSSVRCLVPNAECDQCSMQTVSLFRFRIREIHRWPATRPRSADECVSSCGSEQEGEWTHRTATGDFRTNGITFNLHFFSNYES